MKTGFGRTFKNINQSAGFTLIEILIVLAVIGILSVVVLLAINPTKILKNARDKARLVDLKTVYDALEQYAMRKGQYPGEKTCDSSIGSCNTVCPCNPPEANWSSGSEIWTGLVGGGDVPRLPRDPVNDSNYFYQYEPNCNQGKCATGAGGNGTCCEYYLGCNLETDDHGFVWIYTP